MHVMTDSQLYTEISALPANLKQEVLDFVTSLKIRKKKPKPKERKFGYAKGFFKMTEDFDKPLDDFKEYM